VAAATVATVAAAEIAAEIAGVAAEIATGAVTEVAADHAATRGKSEAINGTPGQRAPRRHGPTGRRNRALTA
jgi:hypothetical protein